MIQKRISGRSLGLLVAAMASLAALGFASAASAHTGAYSRFDQCPSTTPGVEKCVQSVTFGGSVVLGKKTVPIVNPVTLQGGLGEPVFNEKEETFYEAFYGASNGETLSKTPQPVPGGLTGLVNCKEISSFLVRLGCEAIFENGLTGVNSTVELAKPASSIIVNEEHLAFQEGVAMQLPVKVHLENPLLGSTCYIGSSSSPLIWNLSTAPPNGSSGKLEFIENNEIAVFQDVKLADSSWSAPGASGCGGFGVELILDPIINASVGVPSAAGKNSVKLESTRISLATVQSVNAH